jgi:hypothetical protein
VVVSSRNGARFGTPEVNSRQSLHFSHAVYYLVTSCLLIQLGIAKLAVGVIAPTPHLTLVIQSTVVGKSGRECDRRGALNLERWQVAPRSPNEIDPRLTYVEPQLAEVVSAPTLHIPVRCQSTGMVLAGDDAQNTPGAVDGAVFAPDCLVGVTQLAGVNDAVAAPG